MILSGITDSLADTLSSAPECSKCHTSTRVNGGECLSCLLRAAVDDPGERVDLKEFDAVLAEIDLRDTDWRLGNYQILEEVGRGGMGVIYRARQRHSKRIVALKRVLSYHGDSRETLQRFRREAEAAASLDHPNILPIYEVGEADGLPFFTMKYAPGGTLQAAAPGLRKNPRECVQIMANVIRAVAYAHREGILHRDLKPGNILLDGRGTPMVSDFGLAKWVETNSDLTRTLAIFGTPGFIAPEQAAGENAALTPAADVYSLGAILFDLLTGRPPFLGEHALAVLRQAAEKTAPRLRTLLPHADRDLETICAKCLEREPQARYHSAAGLAEDLERWLEGRPILARRVSPLTHGWRWARRNPVLAGAICVCLLFAGIGLTRQLRTQRLQSVLNQKHLAAHSISVLPLLDLDTGAADQIGAEQIASALQSQISPIGLARVLPLTKPLPNWTGAGLRDEVQTAAKQSGHPFILSGTRRRLRDRDRYSLHLSNPPSEGFFGSWILEVPDGSSLPSILRQNGLAPATYQLLSSGKPSRPNDVDPGMENDRARAFITSGQALLTRRNLVDMDRAIACFEGALQVEPRSLTAHSCLAMAYMGRHMLLSDQTFAAKALQTARSGLELAPDNPTALRGCAWICLANGRYADAVDQGLRALERGDQSERVYSDIAFSWRMRGRPDLALRWYAKSRVSRRQPADFDALIGDCYVDLGQDDTAQRAFESAAVYQPDQPEGWIGLAHLKLLAGDTEGARAICRKELPHYPNSPPAAQMAALVEFFARNFARAEELYSELTSTNPPGGGRNGFPAAVDYASALARLRLERGAHQEAQTLLAERIEAEKAHLAEVPEDGESLYRLSAAEAVAGEKSAALQHLQAAAAAGWLDYRSPQLDPRFDSITKSPVFRQILSEMAVRVTSLKRNVNNELTSAQTK